MVKENSIYDLMAMDVDFNDFDIDLKLTSVLDEMKVDRKNSVNDVIMAFHYIYEEGIDHIHIFFNYVT